MARGGVPGRRFAWGYGRRVVVGVVAAVVVYLAVTAVQVWLTSRHRDDSAAQAIVVMGAAQYNGVPSPDLTARLEDALGLYRDRVAPFVVATGSKERGDAYTEAQASRSWLVARGVPSSAIAEVGGNDSWANLSDAAALLHRRGDRTVVIATDGFHEYRSLAIATDVGLAARPVPASTSPITGWSAVPYFAKETIAVAVGRIVGYSHLHRFDSGSATAAAGTIAARARQPDQGVGRPRRRFG